MYFLARWCKRRPVVLAWSTVTCTPAADTAGHQSHMDSSSLSTTAGEGAGMYAKLMPRKAKLS
eukprot:3644498-Amphidinium_carterae.1